MTNRQYNNVLILSQITDYIDKHPDVRFIQALWNLGIIDKNDNFYEESECTLNKMKKGLE